MTYHMRLCLLITLLGAVSISIAQNVWNTAFTGFDVYIPSSENSAGCPFDETVDVVLVDSLSNSFNNTDTVVEDLIAFDFSACDSICMSLTVDTNGSEWIGTANLEWSGECGFGTDPCTGEVEDAGSGSCNNCWDFITAQLVMNDSIYFIDLLGDEEDDATSVLWSSGKVGAPILSLDSGYVSIKGQTFAVNETLNYSGLTVICYSDTVVDADNDGTTSDVDCDDNDPNNFPNNIESCDGRDNNCNGLVDEGLTVMTYYLDADGDGFGNPNESISACELSVGYVDNNLDCNDADLEINPNAIEILNNGIDENCDGIDQTTSTEDILSRIKIYPNPVQDLLIIEPTEELHYEIFSYHGKLLRKGIVTESGVVTTDLQSGIFIIYLYDEEGRFQLVKCLVKMD